MQASPIFLLLSVMERSATVEIVTWIVVICLLLVAGYFFLNKLMRRGIYEESTEGRSRLNSAISEMQTLVDPGHRHVMEQRERSIELELRRRGTADWEFDLAERVSCVRIDRLIGIADGNRQTQRCENMQSRTHRNTPSAMAGSHSTDADQCA